MCVLDQINIELHGSTWESRTTLFGMGDTGESYYISYGLYDVKDTSHNSNEIMLLQEVSHMCSKALNDVRLC